MSVLVKVCRKCGIELPLDAFYRARKSKDGRYSYCKVCSDRMSRAWQTAHPERHREHLVKWKHAHLDKVRAINQRYREQHPERARNSSRRWAEQHRGQRAEYNRQWYQRRKNQQSTPEDR